MKKRGFLVVCILSIGLFICSCSQDESANEVEIGNFNINLEDSNLGKELILLKYNSLSNLQSNIDKKIEVLLEDIQTEITKSKGSITNVQIQLHIKAGKITISEILKTNGNNNTAVDYIVFNEQSNSYNRVPTSNLPDFAKCPEGFTLIDSCSNIGNTSMCVAEAINDFLTGAVSTIGDCAQVQVSVGTFNTKVCGKSC